MYVVFEGTAIFSRWLAIVQGTHRKSNMGGDVVEFCMYSPF